MRIKADPSTPADGNNYSAVTQFVFPYVVDQGGVDLPGKG